MQSEHNVSFKVFVSCDGVNTEVRRFAIDKSAVTSFEYLKAKLQSVFPSIKNNNFTVAWKDDEGDEVIISSDEELILALSSMQDDLKKLFVRKGQTTSIPDEPMIEIPFNFAGPSAPCAPSGCRKREFDAKLEHPNVVCDACEGAVTGFRYKCVTCQDYDLCTLCEGKNIHSEHFMIRIPVPIGPLGSKFSRVLGHKLIKSLKKARAFDPENVEGECPFASKRYRHDRHENKGEKKHGERRGRHEHSHEPGKSEGRPHPMSGRHCGNRGSGWLDMFTTYMNEFANLAGNLNPEAQATPRPAGNANAPPGTPSLATAPPASENPQNGNANNFFAQDIHAQYLQNIGQTVARILDPLGIDVDIEVRPKANEANPSNADTSANNNKKTEAEKKKTEYIDVPVVDVDDNSSSSSDESIASGSAERGEGWTILTGEGSSSMANAKTASSNFVNVEKIGFDLDAMAAEFNKHMELRNKPLNEAMASSSSNTGIYPTVPPTEETQVPQNAASPQVLTPQVVPVPNPAPIKQTYRPSRPDIAAAFDRMIAMGFKDDEGRLARLLEAKNGNISDVLDVLSMNIPRT